MFGNKKLLSEGAEGRAIVLSLKGFGLENKADTGMPVTGQILPVRYDPQDHSKVEIDIPLMKAQREATHDEIRADRIARARAELAQPDVPGPSVHDLLNPAAGDPLPTFEQIKNARRNQ
jgi:hypothetical protein